MSNHSDVVSLPAPGERRLDGVLARMPSELDVANSADVFSLLGDPGRMRLLVALLEGELCVGDLSIVSGQSESAVSHALKLLRAHRVVAVRRQGRRAYYRLDDPHVRMLLDLALTHISHARPEHEGCAPEPAHDEAERARA